MAYIHNKSHRIGLENELDVKKGNLKRQEWYAHAMTGYTNTNQLKLVTQVVGVVDWKEGSVELSRKVPLVHTGYFHQA